MAYTVYMHTCPNGKRYVGITRQKPTVRWKNGLGYVDSPVFYNAIKKYGWSNIMHEILLTDLGKEDAEKMERYYIDQFCTTDRAFGYNCQSGGNAGKAYSAEARAKIGAAHKGKRLSEEQRRRLSEINKGKHHTVETRAKMSASRKGKPHNAEWHRKIGEANRKPVVNLDTGDVFESIDAAGKHFDVCPGSIRNCISGRSKTAAGGYHWAYVEKHLN